jgi:glycine/D-amino acid oxidase-like deaminating enzyme
MHGGTPACLLKDHANIFYAMGFNGTGIAQTPVAGRIMASLVLRR